MNRKNWCYWIEVTTNIGSLVLRTEATSYSQNNIAFIYLQHWKEIYNFNVVKKKQVIND